MTYDILESRGNNYGNGTLGTSKIEQFIFTTFKIRNQSPDFLCYRKVRDKDLNLISNITVCFQKG